MPLLPYDRFDIRSPYPAGELAARLAANVEPRRLLRFGRAERRFEGTVDGASVNIQRIITYRNSFLPRLTGTIEPAPWGSRLSGTMSLHPVVQIFGVVWISFALVGCFAMVSEALANGFTSFVLIPFGMVLFFAILVSASFTFEARRAHALLCEIAGASPAPQRTVRETPA